jgi:hypothetical protein
LGVSLNNNNYKKSTQNYISQRNIKAESTKHKKNMAEKEKQVKKIEPFLDFTKEEGKRCNVQKILDYEKQTYEWNTANGYRWRFLCKHTLCKLHQINGTDIMTTGTRDPFSILIHAPENVSTLRLSMFYPHEIWPNVVTGKDMGNMIAFIAKDCKLIVRLNDDSDLKQVYRALYGFSYYDKTIGMEDILTSKIILSTSDKPLKTLTDILTYTGMGDMKTKIKWCKSKDIPAKDCSILPPDTFTEVLQTIYTMPPAYQGDISPFSEIQYSEPLMFLMDISPLINGKGVESKYQKYAEQLKENIPLKEFDHFDVSTKNDDEQYDWMIQVLENEDKIDLKKIVICAIEKTFDAEEDFELGKVWKN